MEAKLIVVASDQQARQFELRLPATIGRSRSSDVTLGHPLISRRHCELSEAGGQIVVRDLNSMNGTFVGDVRVGDEPVPLLPGEVLVLGSVSLRIDYVASREPRAESDRIAEGVTVDSPLVLASGDSRRFDSRHTHRPSGLSFDGSAD